MDGSLVQEMWVRRGRARRGAAGLPVTCHSPSGAEPSPYQGGERRRPPRGVPQEQPLALRPLHSLKAGREGDGLCFRFKDEAQREDRPLPHPGARFPLPTW